MDRIISINTLAYHGYDLLTALREIAELRVRYVELAFILKYAEDFTESDFSTKNARTFKHMLSEFELLVLALSVHMDLGKPDSVSAFKKRMEFAKKIGATIVHTNACQRSQQSTFLKNIEELVDFAQSFDMIIALENPGDGEYNLVSSGEAGASIVQQIGSDWVKLNYDFCNTYSYSKGNIRPEIDFKYALPFAAHLHLKDMKPQKTGWSFSEIGKGVINYPEIFQILLKEPKLLPMSIELPLAFRRDADFSFQKRPSSIELSKIKKVLKDSIDYIKRLLDAH